jgi:hypothetical protein
MFFCHSSPHPITGAFACAGGGNITVHENSCNGRNSCSLTAGSTLIFSGSCNLDWACRNVSGTAIIGEKSCLAHEACYSLGYSVFGNFNISNNSCNGAGGEIKA